MVHVRMPYTPRHAVSAMSMSWRARASQSKFAVPIEKGMLNGVGYGLFIRPNTSCDLFSAQTYNHSVQAKCRNTDV